MGKDEETQVANMEINWTEGQGEAEQRYRRAPRRSELVRQDDDGVPNST